LLVLYVLERFLYRISLSPHREKLVLKGGLLLAVLDARRTTRDVDLLAMRLDREEESVLGLVAQIALVSVDDGVTFDADSARTTPIREDDLYAGVRVFVPANIGRAKIKLALDVNFGDPVTPGVLVTPYPQLLNDDTFPILGYPIETVLAEKIVTMVALGDLNTRDRDWADVWRLAGTRNVAGSDLQEALMRTARHRQVTLRPMSEVVVRLPQLRQASYAAWRVRQAVDATVYPLAFAEVVDRVVFFAELPLAGAARDRVWSGADTAWR
jgi:hypothetical protein